MMAPAIVKEAEELWETWNIRICILLSFFLQVCLTFLAPWRKSLKKMSYLIWILYLTADAIALYTIGLISNSSDTISNNNIIVFWSPFLLLHLGGPDTITALALEDNELWLRHLLQLATQSAGTLQLFYKAFRTSTGDDLLIPAIVMYVSGCVKYLERTASLYLASIDIYRESIIGKPDAGPNYAALMEEYASRKEANIPVEIKSNLDLETNSQTHDTSDDDPETEYQNASTGTDEELKLVKQAHIFFRKFRGLVADIMFSFKERNESRKFFLKTSGEEAFKIIQIELNFIYDVFFTKIHTLQKARGITRFFSVAAVTSLVVYLQTHKYGKYRDVDIIITYVLLGGALIMECIAVVMLYFSDWAVVAALDNVGRWCKVPLSSKLQGYWLRHRPRRWSEVISQYDLLYYCLNDHPTLFKILLLKRVKDVAENFLYVSKSNFKQEMGNDIFVELKTKAEKAKSTEDAKMACAARGDFLFLDEYADYSKILRPWTSEVDYDESILLWHVATNLCIWNDTKNRKASKFRKYSQILGDYMMYLLIMKPSMTSSVVGIAQVRYQDTCDEVKKFIRRKLPRKDIGVLEKVNQFFQCFGRLFKGINQWLLCKIKYVPCCCCCCEKTTSEAKENKELNELCEKILAVNTELQPVKVKGDRSKSVMFDACRLAKKLIDIGEEKQWEVTFKVWVELLSYAASRSKPTAHVAQLREGGELITMVWLLMAHLGLGEQFRINKGTGWAKLIVHERPGN